MSSSFAISFFTSLVVIENISKSVGSRRTVRLRRPRTTNRLQSELAVLHECEEESSASVDDGCSQATGAFPMQLRKIEVLIKDVDL